ncbi:MAG: GntR family transcriptional regulator [Gaiellaceae bacterium]|jgi:GntR family transcriptional regulator|nr:GntR family transcriptional regulator [Gaiellaceae bacterium]
MKTSDPLYVRVYDEIAARIAAGTSGRGGRLPPERVFCKELGVSRATVRRALAALEADGLIAAVQGRGTFLTRLVEPANTLVSFTQLAQSQGTTPTSEVLRADVRAATIDEGERFRIAPGSEVFDLRRLRKMDSLPVAIGFDVVPLAVAPDLPGYDWTTASLYEALGASGSRTVRADSSIEARPSSADEAPHLGVPEGAAVLDTETTSYAADGRLVDVGRIVYRGDRYRFRATLVIQPPPLPGAG